MTFQEKYQKSKEAGYSDQEIVEFLEKNDPKFAEKMQKSQEAGYNPQEVLDFFNGGARQKEPGSRNWGETIAHEGALTAAPIAETIAGAPKDMLVGVTDFLGKGIIKSYESAAIGIDEKDPLFTSWDENKNLFQNLYNYATSEQPKQRDAPEWLKDFVKIPEYGMENTSPDIRKKLNKATGGFTEPENKPEELYRNFVSNATNLFMTRRASGMSIPKIIGVGLGSELLGEAVYQVTGKEKDRDLARAGSMFLFTLFNPGGAQRHVSNMYNEVRDAIPQNATANLQQFVPRLQNLENGIMRSGIATESTRPVVRDAVALREMIEQNNGRPPLHALLDAKHRINENRARFYSTAQTGLERRTGRELYGRLMREVDDAIEHGLNQVPNIQQAHPLETFRNANQAWSTLHEAENASRFMSRIIPRKMQGSALAAIFEIGFKNPSLLAKGLGAGAAGLGIISGARVLTQVMNSPTLRRYYFETVRQASLGNAPAALKAYNQLNTEWEKESHTKKSESSSLPPKK